MIIYSIISSITCVTYLYLGLLILLFGKKSAVQKSFAGLCAMLALWSCGSMGQHLFQEYAIKSVFDKIYYTGSELFILAGIIFVLYLTNNWNSRIYRIIITLIIIRMATYQVANWGWNLLATTFPTGMWFISHQLISALESLFIPIVVAIWGYKSTLHRERIQAYIIVISTVCGTTLGVLLDFYVGSKGYAPISFAMPLLWMVAVWYAILRYGLMRFSPAQVNRDLISLIDQAVFMIDCSWNITDMNGAARFLIECQESTKHTIPMEKVFVDVNAIKNRIEAVITSGNTFYSHAEFIRTSRGNLISIVANYSIVNDFWEDRIGILVICYPQIDLHAFINHYNLSERQTDILRHIISGRTQAETAEALFISLATVKTHTTSLYNRLGISSRSELYALLRGENLQMTND